MKKNSLTTALLAGLAGAAGLATTAHAVNLNPDGLGQALVYPFYTVDGGNQTIISVVNTAGDVKAVKVRFLESRNSREVLDFNLYLSPYDVWTGSIFSLDGTTGPANLVTADRSCTVPAIRTSTTLPTLTNGTRYAPFRNSFYTGSRNDGGGGSPARTREGHVEIIEMGVLVGGSGAGQLAEEATHVNGTPANCNALINAWTGGVWTGGGASGNTNSPSGGLFGAGSVVDVANGTMLSYNAEAIDGFFSTGVGTDDLHFAPGDTLPTLNQARTGSPVPPVTSYVFRGGPTSSIVTSSWNRTQGGVSIAGIDAVSSVFMVNALYNEYTTDAGLGASTEWVITFPTKRFYVDDVAFGGTIALPTAGGTRIALEPFAGLGFTQGSGATLNGSNACEDVSLNIYDREEITTSTPIDFSPAPEQGFNQICEETNVITFSQAGAAESAILGSSAALNIQAPFTDGWLRVGFPANSDTGRTPQYTSSDGDLYVGLPATGFQAVNVINAAAQPGKLANYGSFFKHRGSRAITASGS